MARRKEKQENYCQCIFVLSQRTLTRIDRKDNDGHLMIAQSIVSLTGINQKVDVWGDGHQYGQTNLRRL
jgi:hypothetical protein